MKKNTILVAYPLGEEPTALGLLENLNSLGQVVLRPYSRLKLRREKADYDVALCLVVDELSIAEAHEVQQSMEHVPTIVVDNASGQSIPVNGFSGLVSRAPKEITDAVAEVLQGNPCELEVETRVKGRKPNLITSRFDGILSRLGGIPQGFETALAAATRHLAWELQAQHAEAYVIDSTSTAHRVFTSSPRADLAPLPEKALLVLQKKGRLTAIGDLIHNGDKPLFAYLKEHDLTVIAPLMSNDNVAGWLALKVDEALLTDDFLDDLHIATHLLGMSLCSSSLQPVEEQDIWAEVLASFETALLIIDSEGMITASTGQTSLLGGAPKIGQPFKALRRGRIREVIAEALRGEMVTETWYDPRLDASVECAASALDSGDIAVKLVRLQKQPEISAPKIELSPFFETLPVPVIAETISGSSSTLPTGTISVADSETILRCATAAKSKNMKSVKLRYVADGRKGRAVMFFETSSSESESQLVNDINDAVEFTVLPT